MVEDLLKTVGRSAVESVCFGEPDPFVRQYFRFRATGDCVEPTAFAYAEKLHTEPKTWMAAAIVKSMSVAGFEPDAIAQKLGTARSNVVVFQRLFFDVRRYLINRHWLATIALPSSPAENLDPSEIRLRMMMAAAFHRGKVGLEQVLTGSLPRGLGELDQMKESIRAVLVTKAYEFAMSRIDAPSNAADLGRLIEYLRLPPQEDNSLQQEKTKQFFANFRQLVVNGRRSPSSSDTQASIASGSPPQLASSSS